jgi:hypothetical protein
VIRTFLVPVLLWARRRALEERRRGRSLRFLVLTAASGALLAVSLALIVAFMWTMWRLGMWPLAALFGLLAAYGYLPWLAAHAIAVPLGRVRLAFHLAAEGREIRTDPVGGGLIAAAWALNRQRTPNPGDVAWLEAKRDGSGRLGDCRIAATGLIAAARGDRDGARRLLESVALIPEITPLARELAGEWLAADDAERGQWRRILERAPRRVHAQLAVDSAELGLPLHVAEVRREGTERDQLWPATPLTFFLEGAAARLLGLADAPGDLALAIRWLEAPRRRHTWGLLQRATAAVAAPQPGQGPEVAEPKAVRPADPVGAAVAAHVVALDAGERGALDAAVVAAAADAWDRALLSPDTAAGVLARAIDLAAPEDAGHRVLDELARIASDDLATVILASDLPVDALAGGKTLEAALQRVRHRLLGDLELAIARTAERVRQRRALPSIDEWRELIALRAAHQRAVRIGGDALRRLAFPHLHEELTPWLVWLWNHRSEHAVSDALTCWLLAESLAVGDAQAIETHAKNATLPLPARHAST